MPEIDDNLVLLGRELAQARLDAALSVSDVAKRAGCSEQYVRMIEAGVNPKTKRPSRPSESKLLGLANAVKHDPRPWFALVGYDVELLDAEPQPARGSVKEYLQILNEAAKHLTERSPIMQKLALDILQGAAYSFEQAAVSGTIEITADAEPLVTQQAINDCETHLRAVSFQDDSWWQSSMGDAYLSHHKKLRERGVEITRIFLVTDSSISSLIPTLQRHLDLGINTFVIDIANVESSQQRDVVIYDERCVREANSIDQEDLDLKEASLTDDPLRVRSALLKFNKLRDMAMAFDGDAASAIERHRRSTTA